MDAPSPDTPANRRALTRSARDAFPPMGIYAVRDLGSGRVRVGASRNVPGTLNRIRFELRLGTHTDKAMQAAWREGGEARVQVEALEMVKERSDPEFDYAAELRALEQLYREELGAA